MGVTQRRPHHVMHVTFVVRIRRLLDARTLPLSGWHVAFVSMQSHPHVAFVGTRHPHVIFVTLGWRLYVAFVGVYFLSTF